MNRAWTMLCALARFALVVRALASLTPAGWIAAIAEWHVQLSTLRACLSRRMPVATEPLALLVPVFYCLPLLMDWRAAITCGPALGIAWALGLAQIAVQVQLGWCVTLGAPHLHLVRSSGCYRCIRHPMAALEMLTTIAIAFGQWSVWNAVVAVLCIQGSIINSLIDERFLIEASGRYRAYTRRVRYRWVPGIV